MFNSKKHFTTELDKLTTADLLKIFEKLESTELTCIELSGKKDLDPIDSLRSHIEKNKIASEAEIKKIDDSVKNEVNEIVEFAKNSPEPDESELLTEIYN